MKLDDLIGLFIFFIFFILPVLSRAFRKNTPSKPASSKRSAAPGTGKSATPTTTASTGRMSKQLEVPPAADEDFAKRLEEARRRVEEALEQRQIEPKRSASAKPKQVTEPERGMFTSKPAQTAPLNTVPASTPPLERGMFAPDATARSVIPEAPPIQRKSAATVKAAQEDRGIAKPLRVQRLPQNRGGTISKHLVSTEPDAVTRGIIWHQILSEPRARRYIRRAPSRRQ